MEQYICIHGHFYQPPRENPWLEAIELEDSAHPYHDWNERITVECYGPNATARILDDKGRITKIVNNYSRMSFNMGPTLLAWMERHAPAVYHSIQEADKESQERYSGHGSALAQCYNHVIMPLANARDKSTQVRWGVRDFAFRFGRQPEGMWLPETAVDTATLEVLAELGIRFTILSPHQAARVRRIGDRSWKELDGARIDPSRGYRASLPSGRTMDLFFYDGPISRAVAFEDLLERGERLVSRLLGAFSPSRQWPQIIHVATDGETYGHHRRHAEMALAYALDYIESRGLARLTNYGEYLEKQPPTHEVQIVEATSWSCAHGIERWRSDCGCHTGARPGWNQAWRKPLREALDWLRDTLEPRYLKAAGRLLEDPWRARDDYIDVILDRSSDRFAEFSKKHAIGSWDSQDRTAALKLLELQRHAMLMYTSCGWFFSDLSGIESVQILKYAARTIQYAEDLFGENLETQFLTILEKAKSNIEEYDHGRRIYEQSVNPAKVDLKKVGAHFAVSSLFDEHGTKAKTYCYTVEPDEHTILTHGKSHLALGRARITSDLTLESAEVTFGMVHMGDHNVIGGVGEFQGLDAYQTLVEDLSQVFQHLDLSEILRVMNSSFGSGTYSLRVLFRDEQRKILGQLLESSLDEAETLYRRFHQEHTPLLRLITALGVPLPRLLKLAAEATVNLDIRRCLEQDNLKLHEVQRLVKVAREEGITLDKEGLEYVLRGTIERLAKHFRSEPTDIEWLKKLNAAAEVSRWIPLDVNLRQVQNDFYDVFKKFYPRYRQHFSASDRMASEWVSQFKALAERLYVKVE